MYFSTLFLQIFIYLQIPSSFSLISVFSFVFVSVSVFWSGISSFEYSLKTLTNLFAENLSAYTIFLAGVWIKDINWTRASSREGSAAISKTSFCSKNLSNKIIAVDIKEMKKIDY